jgi:SAM-dependent methyltransferase
MGPIRVKDYYEQEASKLEHHQRRMYLGDPWNRYWHGERLREILRVAGKIAFSDFLDVGCAEGYYIKLFMIQYGFRIGAGADIAKAYLLKAKKEVPKSSLVLADAHNLPFQENSFDLVLCSEVLEHVSNPELALRELVRVSREYILVSGDGENLFYHFAKKVGLVASKDPYAHIGYGHIHEIRVSETIIPWASKIGCEYIYGVVSCYFPISFLKKHRIPILFIPAIKVADKLISKLPIMNQFGHIQIALLRKLQNQ